MASSIDMRRRTKDIGRRTTNGERRMTSNLQRQWTLDIGIERRMNMWLEGWIGWIARSMDGWTNGGLNGQGSTTAAQNKYNKYTCGQLAGMATSLNC